jgi:hypothetical protein
VHPPIPARRACPTIAAAILLALAVKTGAAQSSALPPTPPTTLTAAPAAVAAAPATLARAAAATPAQPATIIYADGRLAVVADNSSLNQMLREIAHKSGMTVTGGVTEERVFGTYGPGPLGKVLASLLDGTGSNMLLRESSSGASPELVLTPVTGGPTPPNPNAAAYNENDAAPPEPFVPQQVMPPGRSPGMAPGYVPGYVPGPGPSPYSSVTPATGSDAQPNGAGEPQSPNGVKTPQQIFQQLQQLQQQQQQPHP